MPNSVPIIRITSLSGSQPSSVVFGRKTAPFGPELQVSMGHRPLLSFCACKTACLSLELLASIGHRPHLWFCMQNSGFCTRTTSLSGSQTSPVVLCNQNSDLESELQVSMSPSLHLWFNAIKTAPL